MAQTVALRLLPEPDHVVGNYTLTIGARYDEVTVSRIIKLTVNQMPEKSNLLFDPVF